MNARRGWLRAAASAAAVAAGVSRAQRPADEVLRVGPGRALKRIADAARQAPDGAVVEIDAGDYVGDVAVWPQARLTIRGVGGPVRLLAAGQQAEGKALRVVRRGALTVEGIEFRDVRVPDRNGAGIRLESGHLVVRRCRFLDSETGILTGNDVASRLEVEDSEFGHLGAGDGQSHGLYVGAIGHFRLSGCHVHHARVGHLVKSRARFNRIEHNRLVDGPGGQASYELEFPNGGLAEVEGNLVEQGEGTHNDVMVSFGAEGYRWPVNRLELRDNTLVNRLRLGGTFVRVAPGASPAVLRGNLLVGGGRGFAGPGADVQGQRRVSLQAWLEQAQR